MKTGLQITARNKFINTCNKKNPQKRYRYKNFNSKTEYKYTVLTYTVQQISLIFKIIFYPFFANKLFKCWNF